jgi:hypothetical protein
MEDLMSLVDTGSVSECSIMTVTDNTSVINPVILRDNSPLELLVTLSEGNQLRIYCQCQEEENPMWIPRFVQFPTQGHWPLVPDRLLSLGYSWDDKVKDSEYIQRLAQNNLKEFEELTGYHVLNHMDHVICESCRACTPNIRELIFMGNDGTVYTCTIITCQLDMQSISICMMEDIQDVPRQYRYQLVKLTGTITCPERKYSKDLCLAGYITINGVKAYTLFDSGSTTDAVSPDQS